MGGSHAILSLTTHKIDNSSNYNCYYNTLSSTVSFKKNLLSLLIDPSLIITTVTILWVLFDKYIWHYRIFRFIGLSEVPFISGTWKGTINRIGENTPYDFFMEISQTYSKISIETRTDDSTGHSISCRFLCDDTKTHFKLLNYWTTSAKKKDSDQYEDFKGCSLITIEKINKHNNMEMIIMNDYYFTDRNPPTNGKIINLKKVKNNTQYKIKKLMRKSRK